MAATTRTCVIITCDVCQEPWSGDGTYHWDSLGQARTAASSENWFLGKDGTALCGSYEPDHDRKARELRASLDTDDRNDLCDVRPYLEDDDEAEPDYTTWTAPDGTVYDLTKKWRDRHGRIWTYGERASHAFHEPCMITDDAGNGVGTLPWLINEGTPGAGPLTLVEGAE
jgi:hypothetical protein